MPNYLLPSLVLQNYLTYSTVFLTFPAPFCVADCAVKKCILLSAVLSASDVVNVLTTVFTPVFSGIQELSTIPMVDHHYHPYIICGTNSPGILITGPLSLQSQSETVAYMVTSTNSMVPYYLTNSHLL